MRRIGLVSRVSLIVMAVLLAAIVAAIGFDNWRKSHWRPAVLKQVPHIAQTAAIIDVVMRADPAERQSVLRAVSGEVIRAAILAQVPPAAGLTEAPHVAEKVRSLMQTPAPELRAYTDGVKRGLAYPDENLEGVIRRAVLPLPSGQFLVVGVMGYLQPYSFTILGLPSGFWIGMLGMLVAALALVAALRELAPLRRLTETVSRFDGRTPPGAPQNDDGAADTSEIGRLTRAVADMQARVTALLHERSFLIGAISHDAKTYLTRLRLGAESVDDASRREALIRNIDAVAALIDTALDYARGTTSTGERGAIDLADLVAAEIAEHEAADAGRAISAALGEAAVIEGDPVALKRVVANLLDNAEKFGRRAIEVEVARADGRCRLAVSDDGPGVPPAERDSVFSPFYRLEKSRSRQTGGSGLGLAITRQIVEAHGGRITIEAAALGGARVVVDLPARRAG